MILLADVLQILPGLLQQILVPDLEREQGRAHEAVADDIGAGVALHHFKHVRRVGFPGLFGHLIIVADEGVETQAVAGLEAHAGEVPGVFGGRGHGLEGGIGGLRGPSQLFAEARRVPGFGIHVASLQEDFAGAKIIRGRNFHEDHGIRHDIHLSARLRDHHGGEARIGHDFQLGGSGDTVLKAIGVMDHDAELER